jgi:carbamoyltransferase
MITWGISANSHDAALAVFSNDGVEFASHSERFSRVKNDADLHRNWGQFESGLVDYAVDHWGEPDKVVWYEQPWKKILRQLWAGQGWLSQENNIKQYLGRYGISNVPIHYVDHHISHAALGFYTSDFEDATVIVLDSIGEFKTLTVWNADSNGLDCIYTQRYPHSVGLWYSAMTQRLGLKPQEDEYILMGMAAYGDPNRLFYNILDDFVRIPNPDGSPEIKFKQNLHRGCADWRPDLNSEQDLFDIAAATQSVYQYILKVISNWARWRGRSKNLVLVGGCALNCSANSGIVGDWDRVWVPPNPGDAGSAIGCVLAERGEHLNFKHNYLGFNIDKPYPVDQLFAELNSTGIVGVANGRAEFGPRAFGNRSLLADPRGTDIRDRVNEIKRRQQFRPFAPVILEEHATEYFDGPVDKYMQFVSRCRYPEQFPAIVHRDGTSRVQTVSRSNPSGIRKLLERWYKETGCPMLLNTSLNIKGEPMVNTWADAEKFAQYYGVKVY